jgi:HPt (histidine-containing phosphotransfer) domain-containing protein
MVTNLDFLKSFSKNDTTKMKKYIEMYLTTAQEKSMVMINAEQIKDFETLKIAAHTMKSQARYMGIISLDSIIVNIEHICNEQTEIEKLAPLVKKVTEILAESISELNSILKTL